MKCVYEAFYIRRLCKAGEWAAQIQIDSQHVSQSRQREGRRRETLSEQLTPKQGSNLLCNNSTALTTAVLLRIYFIKTTMLCCAKAFSFCFTNPLALCIFIFNTHVFGLNLGKLRHCTGIFLLAYHLADLNSACLNIIAASAAYTDE